MIDTHCHIDDPQYSEDFHSFVQLQKECGVKAILVPGVNTHSIQTVLEACEQYPDFLFPALGLHPEDVKDNWQQDLATIHHAIENVYHSAHRKIVAIGEIGLDYYWDKTYKSQQQLAFQEQLHWATQWNLPVMIHAREATEDMINILKEHPGVQGVMHCFTGSYEVAKQYLDMGFYLGIGGVLTFKNCKLKQVLENIPLDRILLETDAPYMAPVPHRGKRNESRWMYYVAEMLATVYNMSIEDIFMQTENNSIQLFRLKL